MRMQTTDILFQTLELELTRTALNHGWYEVLWLEAETKKMRGNYNSTISLISKRVLIVHRYVYVVKQTLWKIPCKYIGLARHLVHTEKYVWLGQRFKSQITNSDQLPGISKNIYGTIATNLLLKELLKYVYTKYHHLSTLHGL